MPKSGARKRSAAGETIEMRMDPVVADLESASEPTPPTVHFSHRRPMGVHPVPLLGIGGSVALIVAIVLLAAGSVIGGLLVLVLAAASLALFAGGVRQEPHAPAAEQARRAAGRLRSFAGLASVTGREWAGASWELLRIRRRQDALRGELTATLALLGEAVHHEDDERAHDLKQRADKLEQQLGESDRAASSVMAAARRELKRERVGIGATEMFPAVREDH
jgi:hypothetical protein